MKTTLMLVSLCLISNLGFGQTSRNLRKKDELQRASISTTSTSTHKVSKSQHSLNVSKPLTKEELEKKIQAYQVKIDYINSDSNRKQEATVSGALKRLEDNKAACERQLKDLTSEKR